MASGGELQASNDGGATWKELGADPQWLRAATGYAYFKDNTTAQVKAVPLGGGAELSYSTESSVRVASGTKVALSNGSIVDLATGKELLAVEYDEREGFAPVGVTSTGVVVRTTSLPWSLIHHAWDGTSRTLAADLADGSDAAVVGDELRVVKRLASEWQLCSMVVSTTTLSCKKIADRSPSATWGSSELGGNGTGALVSFADYDEEWEEYSDGLVLVEGAKVTSVASIDGIRTEVVGSDGGGRPIVVSQRILYSVAPTGALTKVTAFPTGNLDTEVADITPGRIVVADDSEALGGNVRVVWSRSVGVATIGTQVKAPVRATGAVASGARTMLTNYRVTTMDGNSITTRIPGIFYGGALSGPYLLEGFGGSMMDVTGVDLGVDGTDLFGSRVAAIDAGGTAVTVTDVAKSRTPFKTLAVTSGRTVVEGPYIYGDWVAWTERKVDWNEVAVVHNLVTGAKFTQSTKLYSLGDGFGVTEEGWWRFSDNKVVDVPRGAHDGVNRVAFVDRDKVVIRTIDGFGTSAARVLGVLAPARLDVSKAGARWTPEIDASKGIAAGKIDIRNSSNQVVRSLTTPASTTGSVRNVSWDGKNTAGAAVPNGTYTWTFIANSADGTGAVKAVDGTSTVTGTITVSGAPAAVIFLDVPPGTAHYDHIMWLASQGISTGWTVAGGKEYRPLQPVNRDAMAAFMYRLAGSPTYTAPAVSPFKDVTPQTAFYKEISWLASRGISTGWTVGNGKEFRPLEPVNRDAMAAFLYRLYGKPAFTAPATSPFKDVTPSTAFYKEMAWLASNGISTGWAVSGGAEFRPGQPVNRDAMAAFMHRSYDKWGTPTP